MKRYLLLSFLISTLFSVSAQVITNCQNSYIDTLMYVEQVKTSTLSGIEIDVTNDGGAYGYAGYGQRFEAPDSVKVLGFCFQGFVFSGFSGDTVVCRLYSADGSGMPGTQIDSVIHFVPLVAGFSGPMDSDLIKNCVTFGSGHVLEGDYIITVENFATSDMYLVRNTDGDGAAEDLCLTYYRGLTDPSFNAWYSTFSFGGGWNFDMNFKPIVEYTFDVETIGSSDSICLPDAIIVSSTVSFDDSLLYNKMYNPSYASYPGYTTATSYDYGDGVTDGIGTHTYASIGDYNIIVTDSILATGWTNSHFEIGCGSTVVVSNCTSIGEVIKNTVKVYPNPVNSSLTIESNFIGESELIIYDNQGKIVLSGKLTVSQQVLDVSGLKQGVYFLVVSNNDQVVRKKLQILR